MKEFNELNELEKHRIAVLTKNTVDKDYEVDFNFKRGKITPEGVHTTHELVQLLEKDKNVKFDGIFLAATPDGKVVPIRLNREKFLERYKKASKVGSKQLRTLRESFERGSDFGGGSGNIIGDDYVPLLGGPFNKQLYLHDSLKMFALAFYCYHHDPIARALVNITRDFTLGRGYRVDSKNNAALAVWRAFEKVNKMQEFMQYVAVELSLYGEVMIQWLPDNQKYFAWQDGPNQAPPKVLLPRIRLMDPSTVWEIITYPEDITRVLAYQQVFPTQYQIYTTRDKGETVPSSKFIIQQVPADQVHHHTINKVSNEKRGRSDLYPAFGFLKRLRDTVQYSVVAMAKVAAWAIDTTITGSNADLQAYVDQQDQVGSIPPAGSEHVHTDKIKREYMGNKETGSGSVSAFEWCLNMICASVQIPVSYLGTHLSGGGTRASALVGTEPVAKKFENRQLKYSDIIQGAWEKLMTDSGIKNENGSIPECEITFPELITQDRSQKMKDTALAQELEAITHERMANIFAKELGISNYDYSEEQVAIQKEKAAKAALYKDIGQYVINPLTAKPAVPAGSDDTSTQPKSSAVTSDEKAKIKQNDGA